MNTCQRCCNVECGSLGCFWGLLIIQSESKLSHSKKRRGEMTDMMRKVLVLVVGLAYGTKFCVPRIKKLC